MSQPEPNKALSRKLAVYRVDFSSGCAVYVVAPTAQRAAALVLDGGEYSIASVKRLKPLSLGVIIDPEALEAK